MRIANRINKLGTEAVYNIFAKTKELAKQGKQIIDLSLGQSAESPPKHVIEATIKALKDGNDGYTVPNGIIECREAVGRKIKSLYNVDVSPERIFIMPGGKPTMHYAISFFGEDGVEKVASDYNKSFLGKIPIDIDLRIAADTGKPLVEKNPNHKISKIFIDMAKKISTSLV